MIELLVLSCVLIFCVYGYTIRVEVVMLCLLVTLYSCRRQCCLLYGKFTYLYMHLLVALLLMNYQGMFMNNLKMFLSGM